MKRILITEDDLFLANICRERFELEGFEVILAHDGRVAIDTLQVYPPHLVLLDLNLPVIDGIGVLRYIRERELLRGLPVIVLSNSSYFSGPAQSAWQAGATAFLNKGDHSPQSLVNEVRKLLADVPTPVPKPTWQEPPPLPPRAFIKPANGQIRVIVADDDKVIHGALGFLMEQAGFHVRSAYDGRRALELAEADPPHILVLDGKMPGLDGLEVLSLWHKHPLLSTIPVIMLTAEKSEAWRAGALGHGAVEFLTKPFSPKSLIQLIEQYVGCKA